jgi:hypothetical protein
MYGCAGAKHGIAIKVVELWAGATPNSSTYLNKKSFFALKVQAMTDCNYKFSRRRPSAQGRPMTLTPSLYLDCLNTAEWALRMTRSMSRLYFAESSHTSLIIIANLNTDKILVLTHECSTAKVSKVRQDGKNDRKLDGLDSETRRGWIDRSQSRRI